MFVNGYWWWRLVPSLYVPTYICSQMRWYISPLCLASAARPDHITIYRKTLCSMLIKKMKRKIAYKMTGVYFHKSIKERKKQLAKKNSECVRNNTKSAPPYNEFYQFYTISPHHACKKLLNFGFILMFCVCVLYQTYLGIYLRVIHDGGVVAQFLYFHLHELTFGQRNMNQSLFLHLPC